MDAAAVVGIVIGYLLSYFFRRCCPYADPAICGGGILLAGICIIGSANCAEYDVATCFTLLIFSQILLHFNRAIVADMAMVIYNQILFH
jgi:hypothetical protein